MQCSSPTDDDQPGTPPTSYEVLLVGRVLDKDGRPIPNAVAQLASRQLSGVTNTEGVYRIVDSIADTVLPKAQGLDSVLILRDGQLISTLEVLRYIDTLPDLFIVQRDVYGLIDSTAGEFSRIEVVISGGVIPPELPKVVELWFNAATNGYSGFVYFVYTAQVANFTLYVNVYGADSTFIGRSRTVQFSSLAGDVQVPAIDPTNAFPQVEAGEDTLVGVRDTVVLHGWAADTFGGKAVMFEWKIGSENWVQCSSAAYQFLAPAQPAEFACSLRVTDNDGNATVDGMRVNVVVGGPVADAGLDVGVLPGDSARLRGTAIDSCGRIVKWEWDLGGGVFVETSSGDTSVAITFPDTFVLRVTDDDGNTDVDELAVSLIKSEFGFSAGYDDSDATLDPEYGLLRWNGNDPWNIADDGGNCWGRLVFASTSNPPAANTADSVLYCYELEPAEEAQFSGTDAQLSPFWAAWATRDSIALVPPGSCARRYCSLTDPADATLVVKAARGSGGLYLMADMVDNSWMDNGYSLSSLDVLQVWIDKRTVAEIDTCSGCRVGLYSSALTYSTRQLAIPVGAEWLNGDFGLAYYDENLWSWQMQRLLPEQLDTSRFSDMRVERIISTPNRRAVEVLIPWRLLVE
jgi:hypothetical protein